MLLNAFVFIINITCKLNYQEGPWCAYPGQNSKQEILNVISNKIDSYYYKMDNRILDDESVSYYYHTDLYIGARLNVYNRFIVLVSCDEFTKEFYRRVYGKSKFCTVKINNLMISQYQKFIRLFIKCLNV